LRAAWAIAGILLVLSPGPVGAAKTPLSDQERIKQWTDDLEFFARELPERHINLFFKLPEGEFAERIAALKAGISETEDYEILVGLMRIIAAIGDSHTMLNTDNTGIFHRLPLSLTWFSDGLYVTRTIPPHRDILGKRLAGIEGTDIREVSQRVGEILSIDNASQLRLRGPGSMVIPEVLVALGLAACTDSVVMDIEGTGSRPILPVEWKEDLDWIALPDCLDCDPPLYRQHADSIYWYRYLPDSKTVYVHYRACVEMKGRPFEAFAAELLDFIDTQQVDRVALDLRYNGGGNSAIAQPLIRGLSERGGFSQEGRLFVIIGRRTFSSAMLNSLDLLDNTGALFVGEETGGKPNHFGEVGFLVLRESGAIVTYSKKRFVRYKTDEPSLSPDIPVEMSFSDYMSCRDPVLEAILDHE
jgi:hypothetical protein